MKYHWQSNKTGEIVRNLYEVIVAIINDLKFYKFWNLNWKYSKEGF